MSPRLGQTWVPALVGRVEAGDIKGLTPFARSQGSRRAIKLRPGGCQSALGRKRGLRPSCQAGPLPEDRRCPKPYDHQRAVPALPSSLLDLPGRRRARRRQLRPDGAAVAPARRHLGSGTDRPHRRSRQLRVLPGTARCSPQAAKIGRRGCGGSPTAPFAAVLTGHASWVNQAAFSPDGTLLATG
jgi:hypothetical protein